MMIVYSKTHYFRKLSISKWIKEEDEEKIQSLNENIRISMELGAKLHFLYMTKTIPPFQLCKLQLGTWRLHSNL